MASCHSNAGGELGKHNLNAIIKLNFLLKICWRRPWRVCSFLQCRSAHSDVPLLLAVCLWASGAEASLVEEVRIIMMVQVMLARSLVYILRYLTRLQMLQFVCVFMHALQPLYYTCDYPKFVPKASQAACRPESNKNTFSGHNCKCSCFLYTFFKLLLLCLHEQWEEGQTGGEEGLTADWWKLREIL